MSSELIAIEPTGVYDTRVLQHALGESLWRRVGPRLPRLCRGRVLGEDVLTVLRNLSTANSRGRAAHLPPSRTPRLARTITRSEEAPNEITPSRRPLRISDDCLAR